MKNLFINRWSEVLLLVALVSFSSCKKDTISPPNQSTAFIKYYGHVATQTAADLLRTDDGGYILLGSTNSYTKGQEKDIFVVRTDSLGNEIWSSSFGRSPGTLASRDLNDKFKNVYLRYDEEGVRLAKLPDGSAYALACNRTYVKYADEITSVGTRGETKIVLYKIDAATGAPTDINGKELHTNSADSLTEKVSDLKIDSSSGVIKYVLTGVTTYLADNKAVISGNNNKESDLSDIYIMSLDENFDYKPGSWLGRRAYGFVGKDFGVSIHVLPGNYYLVCGAMERNQDVNGRTFKPRSELLAVFIHKETGAPYNPYYCGVDDTDFKGGQAIYDPTTKQTTLLGYVEKGVSAGKLVMLKIDENLNPILVKGRLLTFLDVNGTANSTSPYISASIAELPDKKGYIISATHRKIVNVEHDICIIKVNENFEIATGWPYFFGYNEVGGSGVFATQEQAGTVIPVTKVIAGTSQRQLTGYAFTGTFGLGTNDMLGLVKLNKKGTFTPE